ncbi:hypothetical protein [Stenomitos frigidus]|uniref:Nif11 domain-containing protein n=1 Tax=Stenomitos frigidus ULC18 TaxID=2107698 RepID=A0A2T1DUX4_9CYAN|nr:hypothetical protein [Stenomitos frigidus]PSB24295.1 hypothetical protein C7B82_27845 [Stenomitos frigidus ULC18]
MAPATVLRFMQKTAEDEALRQELEALLGVGDGNISSEAELDAAETEALKGERAPVVAAFAAQNGYAFSAEDLVAVVDAFQKHQSGELSDAEFATFVDVSVDDDAATLVLANPLKRLTHYLGKTYLGIG